MTRIVLVGAEQQLGIVAVLKARECQEEGANLAHQEIASLLREQTASGTDFWLAYESRTPAGFAAGKRQAGSYLITGIFVAPEYRKQGIGKELLRAQLEYASLFGCSHVWSPIAPSNLPSIRMCTSLGGEVEHCPNMVSSVRFSL